MCLRERSDWRGRKGHLLRGSVRDMRRKRLWQAAWRIGSLNMMLSRALNACYTTGVALLTRFLPDGAGSATIATEELPSM